MGTLRGFGHSATTRTSPGTSSRPPRWTCVSLRMRGLRSNQTAAVYGVSEANVSQIRRRASERLQSYRDCREGFDWRAFERAWNHFRTIDRLMRQRPWASPTAGPAYRSTNGTWSSRSMYSEKTAQLGVAVKHGARLPRGRPRSQEFVQAVPLTSRLRFPKCEKWITPDETEDGRTAATSRTPRLGAQVKCWQPKSAKDAPIPPQVGSVLVVRSGARPAGRRPSTRKEVRR